MEKTSEYIKERHRSLVMSGKRPFLVSLDLDENYQKRNICHGSHSCDMTFNGFSNMRIKGKIVASSEEVPVILKEFDRDYITVGLKNIGKENLRVIYGAQTDNGNPPGVVLKPGEICIRLVSGSPTSFSKYFVFREGSLG